MGHNLKLDIKEISFSLSKVEAHIVVNDALEVDMSGDISIFDALYDINYHIKGDEIAFANVHFEDKVALDGRFEGNSKNFRLQGEGLALEGKVRFSLVHQGTKERDILLKLQKIDAAKLFTLLGKKPLLAGTLSVDGNIPRYSQFEKEGDVRVDIHRSGVYLENIRQLYGIELPDDFMLQGDLHLHLANETDTIDATLASTLATLHINSAKISEANKKIRGLYHLEIKELATLQFLTKKRFSGAFVGEGEFVYQDSLRVDGASKSLGGLLEYYYEKGTLEAKLDRLSLEKMFTTMSYPPIMIGDISGKAEVDSEKNVAVINLRSENLHFERNSMIETIRRASSVDIAKELFTKSYFTSTVEQGIVYYDFKAENSTSHIYLLDAKMDSHQNTIDSHFDLKMQGEALSGEVYGTLASPKVRMDISKYIGFKAKKEIDDFFGIGTSQKIKKKLKDVDIDTVKGFIKGLF